MRIYRMQATFGKLEHETLTLEPGLNVITAPNEWGKSTWCAFLAAMLYGLDTRAKSTKTALADKERYAPWSGKPMSGRMDLRWGDRDITIERTTKGRVPMGEFRAYETQTGVAVPELTAANCGEMLLGVEQAVFRRAGFIRFSDLPLTQDESLSHRLNALVTTGDDSGAAERLAEEIKSLKNRCRYNSTGLIPQTEAERDTLMKQLAEQEALSEKSKKLSARLEEIKSWLSQLYNHQQALAYAAAQENAARAAEAKQARDEADAELEKRKEACQGLAGKEESEQRLRELRSLRDDLSAIQQEKSELPSVPTAPELEEPFQGMTPEDGLEMIKKDARALLATRDLKLATLLIVMGLLGALATVGLWLLKTGLFTLAAGIVAAIALVWGVWELVSQKMKAAALKKKYGSGNIKRWADPIWKYRDNMTAYKNELREYQELKNDLEVRMLVLRKRKDSLCGQEELNTLLDTTADAVSRWDAFTSAEAAATAARKHFEVLSAMVKPVEKPTMPDRLTHSEADTSRLLTEIAQEQQRMQNRLGQYQGRMAVLGEPEDMKKQLSDKKARIASLEETYAALTMAQETLSEATAELQRRYAPRITHRAQDHLSQLTGDKYNRIIMSEDFTLQTGTAQEDTLRQSLWRSDGTVDQLYLAMRLAVAEELTPEAPLILDDALVRFDDERMKAAVELLKELGQSKQILLFTCQAREAEA